MSLPIPKLIEKGLAYIAAQQLVGGGFHSYSSPDLNNFDTPLTYRTTFITSVIGGSLAALPESAGRTRILRKVAKFLRGQINADGSCNYWDKYSQEAKRLPYPNDLDDTSCAWGTLTCIQPSAVTGQDLARVVGLLTATEIRVGGPYRTWLVTDSATKQWQDVDLVVNLNIGYLLSLHGVQLPSLHSLADTAIKKGNYRSAYYPTAYPIFYFLSRFSSKINQTKLTADIFKARQSSGSWGSPLSTALAVMSLLRLGISPARVEPAIHFLISAQIDNHWPAEGFCLDPAVKDQTYYAGSAELTTAFCLEALNLFYERSASVGKVKDPATFPANQNLTKASQELPRLFRRDFLSLAKKITEFDQSVSLLPYWFAEALCLPTSTKTTAALSRLSRANIYGWVAYTIYDDFFDGEGQPPLLPLANICLRKLTELFLADAPPKFPEIFNRIMAQVDEANAREITTLSENPQAALSTWSSLKSPFQISSLSQKSLGHALGPLWLLSKQSGVTLSDFKAVENFFSYYLVARQLNDDAHDWEQDIATGRVTYVGWKLCQDAALFLPKDAAIERVVPKLKEVFWQTTVVSISKKSLGFIQKAAASLEAISVSIDAKQLELLLEPVTKAAQKTLTEQQRMTLFLDEYQVS